MQAAERGAARNTCLAYAADLQDMQAFAAERGEAPEAVSAETLSAYIRGLHGAVSAQDHGAAALVDPRVLPVLGARGRAGGRSEPAAGRAAAAAAACRNTSARRRWTG